MIKYRKIHNKRTGETFYLGTDDSRVYDIKEDPNYKLISQYDKNGFERVEERRWYKIKDNK